MKNSATLLYAVLAAAPVVLSATPSYAGWRCMATPGQPECEDQLINDIENTTINNWPVPAVFDMPAIPWRCQEVEHCPHCLTSGPSSDKAGLAISTTGSIPWSVSWLSGLNSFFLGQTAASASLAGSIQVHVTGTEVGDPIWDAGISYTFTQSTTEVMSGAGPTGVADLGGVSASFATGTFWTATIPVAIVAPAGVTSCTIAGQTAREGTGHIFRIDYPINAITVSAVIAEGIRNQFRNAVYLVVNGMT